MKQRIREMLPRNKFLRSVSVLAGGTAAGQIIVVAASPILTRLYSPEDFGLLAVYAGLLSILGVVASLRYHLAIALPERDEEAAYVTVLSLLVVLGMTSFTALVVAIFGPSITAALNTPALEPFLWLLPIGLLLIGIYQVFNHWAIRVKAFTVLARTKLTQAIGMVGIQLGGHALGPVALLLGQATGHGAGAGTLGVLAIRRRWELFSAVRPANVVWAARRYRRFPIYSSWGGALNTAGTQLPLILFAALFSPAAAGIYLLAHRVLTMPMQLIGMAIADVFYSSASEAIRNGRVAPLVSGIHSKLAHIAMPPVLVLLIAGPELFEIAFGSQWREAGDFARWLSPYLYMQFTTSPLSRYPMILEKQGVSLLFQITLFLTQLLGLAIGAYFNNLYLSIVLFSIGGTLCWIGLLVWIMRYSGNAHAEFWYPTACALAISIILIVPLLLCSLLAVSTSAWLIGMLLTSILIISRYVVMLKQQTM